MIYLFWDEKNDTVGMLPIPVKVDNYEWHLFWDNAKIIKGQDSPNYYIVKEGETVAVFPMQQAALLITPIR